MVMCAGSVEDCLELDMRTLDTHMLGSIGGNHDQLVNRIITIKMDHGAFRSFS